MYLTQDRQQGQRLHYTSHPTQVTRDWTEAMTSETIRVHPLSDRQERRLLDYLEERYLEIHYEHSRRSVYR